MKIFIQRHFSMKISAFYHTKQANLELFKQKLQKTAWTAPCFSSKMRRISKREITDFNGFTSKVLNSRHSPRLLGRENAENSKMPRIQEIFLITKSVLRPASRTWGYKLRIMPENLFVCLFVCLFVWVQPENLYFAPCVWREVITIRRMCHHSSECRAVDCRVWGGQFDTHWDQKFQFWWKTSKF